LGCFGRRAPTGARISISRFLLWVSVAAWKLYTKSIGYPEIPFGKLEGGIATSGRPVLRNSEEVFGGSQRISRNEAGTAWHDDGRKTDLGSRYFKLNTVPTLTIKPGNYLSIRFNPLRAARISVETSGPVDIYVVSENDYPNFSKRHSVFTAKYPQQTKFETSLNFGPEVTSNWYLVFENRSNEVVAVHYEVFG